MTEADYREVSTYSFGKTLWKGPVGLERVPGGFCMHFHDMKSDTITASVFIQYML